MAIFAGNHPSECVKVKRPSVASANLTYKFVLITNRKLHMGFRLVPKSVTLNDPDPRNGHYFALFCQIR